MTFSFHRFIPSPWLIISIISQPTFQARLFFCDASIDISLPSFPMFSSTNISRFLDTNFPTLFLSLFLLSRHHLEQPVLPSLLLLIMSSSLGTSASVDGTATSTAATPHTPSTPVSEEQLLTALKSYPLRCSQTININHRPQVRPNPNILTIYSTDMLHIESL